MALSDAEKQRAYRIRKRNNKIRAGTLRPVGRPKQALECPESKRLHRIEQRLIAAWGELKESGVEDVSYRSLRRRANRGMKKLLEPKEITYWLLRTQEGTDHFYCDGESLAGLPLKITVCDPA